MRRAYADRNEYVGDPDFVKVPISGLLDPAYLAKLRATIDPERATPSDRSGRASPSAPRAWKRRTTPSSTRRATRSRSPTR